MVAMDIVGKSKEDVTLPKGSQLLSTTMGTENYVQSEFLKVEEEIILPNKQMFPYVTLDDFLWAYGILRSRAFSRLRGESLVLIPVADLEGDFKMKHTNKVGTSTFNVVIAPFYICVVLDDLDV